MEHLPQGEKMKKEKYLFDTDAITNIFKPKPSKTLQAKLKSLPRESQFISTITIGEIIYGAMKSNRPEFHLKNLRETLMPTVNIVGFDAKAAFYYGEMRAAQEKKGKPLSAMDLQIAAIAKANDLVLVTGNVRHFKLIEDFRVENWL